MTSDDTRLHERERASDAEIVDTTETSRSVRPAKAADSGAAASVGQAAPAPRPGAETGGGVLGPTPVPAPAALRENWVGLALLGAVLIAGGFVAMAMPVATGVAAALVIGIAFLVAGLMQGWHAIRAKAWRGRVWQGLAAGVCVVGGALLAFDPLAGSIALSLLIVALLIADGLARVMAGVSQRPERGWGWLTASGALSAALGIGLAAFALPATSMVLLGAAAGVSILLQGLTFLYVAFAVRPASDRNVTPDAG